MTTRPPLSLTVRRLVPAARERVFAAWVEPRHLLRWWGPKGVDCAAASIDCRVGGRYRIDNRLADGSILSITGEYLEITRPSRLVFRWRLAGADDGAERVTVDFLERHAGAATEVVVTHERIADQPTQERHAAGWDGCLAGLARYLDRPAEPPDCLKWRI